MLDVAPFRAKGQPNAGALIRDVRDVTVRLGVRRRFRFVFVFGVFVAALFLKLFALTSAAGCLNLFAFTGADMSVFTSAVSALDNMPVNLAASKDTGIDIPPGLECFMVKLGFESADEFAELGHIPYAALEEAFQRQVAE